MRVVRSGRRVAVLALALLVGPVLPGPMSVGPMSVGPVSVGPVPAGPVSLGFVPVASAEPTEPTDPPPPPPSPGTAAQAATVGALVGRVSALQSQLDAGMASVGRRQETANRALADDTAARTRAAVSRRSADDATGRARAAATALEEARRRVDVWTTAWFQDADLTSPTAVLAGATGPGEVLDRAEIRESVTADQTSALDAFARARAAAADSEARAHAARADADTAAGAAATSRRGAETELARARTGVDTQQRALAGVAAERDTAQATLRSMEASDAALAAQRRRAEALAAANETQDRGADATAAAGARSRLAGPSGDPVRTVVDRALSELGTVYAWGGGNGGGPTQGIRDGGTADAHGDFGKVGFDCSGLMVYAFAGVGKELPHYSGYQETAGVQLPLAQRRPGDLLFWADGDDVHHVALYIGGDRMVEAPESGSAVRETPVRFGDGIVPTVTRLL